MHRLTLFVALMVFGLFNGLRSPVGAEHAISGREIGPTKEYQLVAQHLADAVNAQMQAKAIPAVSVALVADQQTVWARGFGLADPAEGKPAEADTVYRVGSVSKLFTALAVMQLVEKGELDLDAPVQKYLPDFRPENPIDKPTTLRQIHSHQSGLVREPPVGNYFDATEPSLEQMVESLNNTRIVYRPQTKAKYSNAAVSVAGYVVEKQTQQPFPQRVQEKLLAPMGMKNSGFTATHNVRSRLAKAQMWTYDGRTTDAPPFLLGTGPAGNLYASAADLANFIKMLLAKGKANETQIVRPETLEEMWKIQFAKKDAEDGFGLGFYVSKFQGHRRVGHSGAVYGFSTNLSVLPDDKLGVAVIAAKDVCNGTVTRIAEFALKLLLAAKKGQPLPTLQQSSPLPPERAKQLEGRYRDDKGNVVELQQRGDKLVLLTWDSKERNVRSTGDGLVLDDEFGFGPALERRSADELAIGDHVCRRIPDRRPPPAPKKWRGLIGEYGEEHNVLYILERYGKLYALIEWFFYYPLTEVSKNVFAFPDFGMYHGERLVFERDDTGRAKQVIAADVTFTRRDVGAEDGRTFHIRPVKPIDELRQDALAASPPNEDRDFRKPQLTELAALDASIKLDIRYATKNNFMQEVFYKQPRAFLQQPAAEAVLKAHRALKKYGFGLLIHDAYRPWHVTKMFFDATPESLKRFVADPSRGSRHNRGAAVDLTLYDRSTNEPVQMVSGYDEFSPRSYPYYPGGQSIERWRRRLLRRSMEQAGFTVYEFEWWHFDYRDWREYPILNTPFEQLQAAKTQR